MRALVALAALAAAVAGRRWLTGLLTRATGTWVGTVTVAGRTRSDAGTTVVPDGAVEGP